MKDSRLMAVPATEWRCIAVPTLECEIAIEVDEGRRPTLSASDKAMRCQTLQSPIQLILVALHAHIYTQSSQ